jgi:hypothetical protein
MPYLPIRLHVCLFMYDTLFDIDEASLITFNCHELVLKCSEYYLMTRIANMNVGSVFTR